MEENKTNQVKTEEIVLWAITAAAVLALIAGILVIAISAGQTRVEPVGVGIGFGLTLSSAIIQGFRYVVEAAIKYKKGE